MATAVATAPHRPVPPSVLGAPSHLAAGSESLPADSHVTQAGVRHQSPSAQLLVADAEALPFEDGSFDVVVATFLFCSVPDAVRGLREARRMLAPGGRLLLLEHVLSERPILRALMRWADPIPFHVWGAHIDRETVASVRTAGLVVLECQNKSLDIVKLIVARPPEPETAAITMGTGTTSR